jgi:ATP-dependent DNA helicase RecG
LSYPPFHPSGPEPPLFVTEEELAQTFPAEDGYIERKSGIGDALQDVVVAFSNADGGVILVGVRDDGEVLGKTLTPGIEDDIHRRLGTIEQPGRYTIHELTVGSKSIVVVSIARRSEGFAQTSSGRVLVRRGTMSVALFGTELARFINERSLGRFEDTSTGIPVDEADPELLHELSNAYGWTEDVLRRLSEHGLIAEDGHTLTVAGALYLLRDPAEPLGKAYIELLRYPGDETDYDKRLEFRGPVQRQVADAVSAISAELGSELVVLGIRRYELARIPEVVLREALANAVAHRSYELNGTAVRVEITPHAVRVISPGGLPEPVTIENIRETQAARNVRVIQALRRFGVAEDAGRGVDVMVDSMRDELLEDPVFEDDGHSVRVTLPIRSAVTPQERAWIREVERRGFIEPGDRFLLIHAARGETLTNARARTILNTADSGEVRRALQRLRDQGFVQQHGTRGGASYVLTESLQPPAGFRLSPEELREMILADARDPETRPLTNARVRALTGLDRLEALALLESLMESGHLRRLGTKRGTRYEPAEE